MIRLDKYISQSMGITRTQAKDLIKKKQFSIQNNVLTSPDYKFDETKDIIYYQGKPLSFEEHVTYMLNKPSGVVSATIDNVHQTVIDLIEDNIHKDLFPVGRLDIDTVGLLLITNDGELGHHLTSPKHHVDKTYYVKVDGKLTQKEVLAVKNGIDYGETFPSKPGVLEIIESKERESSANITIHEGKFHQVKRMFQALGFQVTYLKRIQMGSLKLDESLKEGEYRKLTEKELSDLL